MDQEFLTARQAATALGVSRSTLYAYVSRGMLRSEAVPGDPRARRYGRAEVERLLSRKALRRDPEGSVPTALDWGTPVLESAITLIEGGRLFYRGHDALLLARRWSVEEVAALLWTGDSEDSTHLFAADRAPQVELPAAADRLEPVERCQVALPLAAVDDFAAWDLRPSALALTGARIVRLLISVVSGRATSPAGLVASLDQDARPGAAAALRGALILCADHELNVSSFTARCVASAESTLYDVVGAGLGALRGRRHGGCSSQVEALMREIEGAGEVRRVLADRLRRGEEIPGFGHPLYPAGDPRAKLLLELAGAVRGGAATLEPIDRLITAARALIGEEPTVDVALVALARVLELPPGGPVALFALGRSLGWIGQAIEQYGTGRLIRPRARYSGPRQGEA
ncbi:MAG: citrate synthase family protein [Acidobacteriota bacterium]